MKRFLSYGGTALRFGVPPTVVFVVVIVGWQVGVEVSGVAPYFIPSPRVVAAELVAHWPELRAATVSTGRAAIAGFLLSLVTGCLIAFLMAQTKVIERSLYPYAIFLQTVPIIAIAPIVIFWLGPGMPSIIAVAFIISLFPIVTNTTAGLTQVPAEWLELLAVYQASWWQRLVKLRLPAAIPGIVTGAKVSAGLSVVGAIVGEYFTSVSGKEYGIAYLVVKNTENIRTPYLFATILMSALLGLLIFGTVSLIGGLVLRLGHFQDRAG